MDINEKSPPVGERRNISIEESTDYLDNNASA